MYETKFKRLFDIVVVLAAMPFALPIIGALALAVKLGSRGPVFFRQQRGARGDANFTILKFRSMRVDRDAEKKGFEPGGKSRVTAIGKLLRKTKLDELPQLFNVLRGDMSLVGPRPEVPAYLGVYPERWKKVRRVRPGITDPASIVFRDEEELLAASQDPETTYREIILPRKLDLYERYVDNLSFSGDIKILCLTVLAVMGRPAGADVKSEKRDNG